MTVMQSLRRFPVWLLVLSAGLGCSSHSIRNGIWRLSYDLDDVKAKVPVSFEPKRVRVTVDWSDEIAGAEAVELENLDDRLRIYGYILEGGEEFTVKLGQDASWVFSLWGKVRDRETIDGHDLLAKSRASATTALRGRWKMIWIGD